MADYVYHHVKTTKNATTYLINQILIPVLQFFMALLINIVQLFDYLVIQSSKIK